MDYDSWKTMTPEEANGTEYDECANVSVNVKISDLGDNSFDDFKDCRVFENQEQEFDYLITTINVEVPLIHDDWEKETYVEDDDVEDAVAEYLGNGCEYEILNWRIA